MNSLSRLLRVVMWGVVTGGLLSFVRQWNVRQWNASQVPKMAHDTQPGGFAGARRLYRDPCCGTHMSPEISLKVEKSGQITHFCSAECRDRYARLVARAAGA
jgi:YHS domain-containing protein